MKKSTGSSYDVESQLQEACQACVLNTNEDVYAISTIGTSAKMFQYTRNNHFLELTNGYVGASTPQAQDIRDVVNVIKRTISANNTSVQYDSFILAGKTGLTFTIGHIMYSPPCNSNLLPARLLQTAGILLLMELIGRGTTGMAHGQIILLLSEIGFRSDAGHCRPGTSVHTVHCELHLR